MKTIHFRLTLMGSCVSEQSFEHSGQKFTSQWAAHGSPALSRWGFLQIAEEPVVDQQTPCGMLLSAVYFTGNSTRREGPFLSQLLYFIILALELHITAIYHNMRNFLMQNQYFPTSRTHTMPCQAAQILIVFHSYQTRKPLQKVLSQLYSQFACSVNDYCLSVLQVIHDDKASHNCSTHHLELRME